MTLSLGLRYERNTPVQTYEGLASMLNAEQTAIIPTSFPAVGFEFHEPNTQDWGPRLGATYRLSEKTVVRAGWGIYYNPNQMNSFTFLTNNPPIAAEFTFSNSPTNPTLSFDQPFGVVGPGGPPNMITPNRHLPNARKNQWSADLQHEIGASVVLELQYLASRTENLDRSFFNNTPLPGAGGIDAASSEPVVPRDPHDRQRPDRRLRLADGRRAAPHGRRVPRQRALHLVEDARHGHPLQRRRPDREQLRHLQRLRPGQLGRAAPARGELRVGHAVLQGLRQRPAEGPAGWLAGGRGVDDPERHAAQRHHRDRPRQHRPAESAAEPRERRRRVRAASRTRTGSGWSTASTRRPSRSPTRSPSATRHATTCAGRSTARPTSRS